MISLWLQHLRDINRLFFIPFCYSDLQKEKRREEGGGQEGMGKGGDKFRCELIPSRTISEYRRCVGLRTLNTKCFHSTTTKIAIYLHLGLT